MYYKYIKVILYWFTTYYMYYKYIKVILYWFTTYYMYFQLVNSLFSLLGIYHFLVLRHQWIDVSTGYFSLHQILIKTCFGDNILIFIWRNIVDYQTFFILFYLHAWVFSVNSSCNNVAPVTNLCLGRATTRSHSSQWSKKKVAVET